MLVVGTMVELSMMREVIVGITEGISVGSVVSVGRDELPAPHGGCSENKFI